MLEWMPGPLQGVYWFNGAMNYTLFYGILLIMVCSVAALCDEERKTHKIVRLFGASILGIIMAGGNHVTAFETLLLLFGLTLLLLIKRFYQKAIYIVGVLIFTLAGFVINVVSPGTANRQSCFSDRPGAIGAIIKAIFCTCKSFNSWITVGLIASVVIVLPIIVRVAKAIYEKYGFRFRYPLLVFIFSICLLCAMWCPSFYAMNSAGETRLSNVIYFSFVILSVFNLIYILGWIKVNTGIMYELNEKQNIIIALVMVVLILFGARDYAASYIAYMQMEDGSAQQYSREAFERDRIYENGINTDVVVNSYTVYPGIIFFDDIVDNPEDWRNRALSEYYKLNSVVRQE